MKGISAVVATILLLLITVALATVAYLYITNVVSFRTAKTFQVLSPSCSNGQISFVLSNQGTQAIANTAGSGDVTLILDNALATSDFLENGATGDTTFSISPGQSVVLVRTTAASSGTHQLRVTTSSDSQTFTIFC